MVYRNAPEKKLVDVEIKLTKAELTEAVCDWYEKHKYVPENWKPSVFVNISFNSFTPELNHEKPIVMSWKEEVST